MQGQSRLQHFHWFIIGHNSLLGVVVFDGTVSDPGPASPSNKREKILKMDPVEAKMTFGDHVQSTFGNFFGNFSYLQGYHPGYNSREATKGLGSTPWNCAQRDRWVFQAGEPLLLVDDDVFGPVLSTVRTLGDFTIR